VRAALAAGVALFLALAPASGVFAQTAQSAAPQNRDAILAEIRRDLPHVVLPAADSIVAGTTTIAAGSRVSGPLAVWGGDLEILGTVDGDVTAIDGDVIVGDSGRVNGDVLAVRGETRVTGRVTGSVMRLEGNLSALPVAPVGARVGSAWRPLGVALGTLGMLLMMGIGVLIFAGPTLESVVEVLERRLSRSLLVGIGAELALLPGLLLLCVALAVTLLGLLLIPFAIVAYALAVAGTLTLGFLAVAAVVGGAIARRRAAAGMTTRAASLRAMMIGVVTLLVLWIVAAAFVWSPLAAAIIRLVAAAFTWVAVTAGFGAVILSRIGSRRIETHAEPELVLDDLSWQTPTPVSGVAAARRPTPIASGKTR
jgi:hypothetical protein